VSNHKVLLSILSTVVVPILVSLGTVSAAVSSTERAQGLAGGEWTVSNPDIVNHNRKGKIIEEYRAKREAIELWIEEIKHRCPDCSIEGSDSTRKITSPNHPWISVTIDQGVLEVNAKPMRLNGYVKNAAYMQNLIWNSAKSVGLLPQERMGGGHIHLDIRSHFGNDSLLFRNFLVDLMNRPELFLGGLGFNLKAAPPLALMPPEFIDAFEKVIRRFDKGKMSREQLMDAINLEVYDLSKHGGRKNHAINLDHRETIEIRGNRPQESLEHFIKLIELFESRIDALREFRQPIPFIRKDFQTRFKVIKNRSGAVRYDLEIPAEEIERAMKNYVEDSRLNWADYRLLKTKELGRMLLNEAANEDATGAASAQCREIFSLGQVRSAAK
jgi:hypothetical protein